MTEEITKQTEAPQVEAAQGVEALTGELLPPAPDARALNALSHGLTAQHVRPDEREGYAQHVEQVRASTGAQGYLEQRLADRAALALWRLDRVAAYEAAQSSVKQREAAQEIAAGKKYGVAETVTAAYDLLHDLIPWASAAHLRQYPQAALSEAQRLEERAQVLDLWATGKRVGKLDPEQAAGLGFLLSDELMKDEQVKGAQLVKAMTGRPAKRGEGQTVEESEWEYETRHLPGLVKFAREHWGQFALSRFLALGTVSRMKAGKIRLAYELAQAAERDVLTLAALPSEAVLNKVTRYEAHLERTLYRALHDLEAARREREGKESPGPLRGVLDEAGLTT